MTSRKEMDTVQVLDTLGELIAALAALAVTGAGKIVHARFREGSAPLKKPSTNMKRWSTGFGIRQDRRIGSSTDFSWIRSRPLKPGRIFDAVPPLLQGIERLVDLHKEEKVSFNSAEQNRIREFQQRLEKILPEASKPEVDLPTPETY